MSRTTQDSWASPSAPSSCCSSSWLVAVSLLFDPNDYKDDIAAAVQNATGRRAHARRRPRARAVPDDSHCGRRCRA